MTYNLVLKVVNFFGGVDVPDLLLRLLAGSLLFFGNIVGDLGGPVTGHSAH